jgi:methyltransferase-like protein/2-polyprenyl-3-methyl-5-hydroxy-6-metoxy-1,4-benzoquinol methylase
MDPSFEDSYDAVPYESYPFRRTHPDSLAVVATLFGMTPPPVEHCRVLELGCAGGGNLIPMALGLPQARFVGIDLSRRQIDDGRRIIDALGLDNIELRPLSLMDVGEDFGRFDYVLAHGIYSWVPAAVQDKILSICDANLAPGGVAYVSYNTYPGWHQRGMIREMMAYHARQFDDPAEKTQQARSILRFLADAVGGDSPYGQILGREVEMLADQPDYYILHEYLERDNAPLYFHEFAARAAAHGLQYVAEAHFKDMMLDDFPERVQQVLRPLAENRLELEQYTDFLRNRKFRQTLLCHQDVRLGPRLSPEALFRFHVASVADPVSLPAGAVPDGVEEFRAPGAEVWGTESRLMRTAIRCLREVWPRAVPFAGLVQAVRARLGQPEGVPAAEDADVQHLVMEVLQAYVARVVRLHVHPPAAATSVSERPVGSPLARLQAPTKTRVSTLDHTVAELGDLDRQVLVHLDGSRDREALLDVLTGLVRSGVLVHHEGGGHAADAATRAELAPLLDECLARLVSSVLLLR